MYSLCLQAETNCDIVGFHNKLVPLEVFKDRSKKLEQLVDETHRLGFGTTDCSKPMTWARKHRKEYDAFIVYTDSETNSHRIPPHAALEKYRQRMNIPTAKLIVVGMTSSNFTIAKPDDLHMLDVVGFDRDTPDMIREFIMGGFE
jgi:60 kDa SS-A/Ro ribonucleoprotein